MALSVIPTDATSPSPAGRPGAPRPRVSVVVTTYNRPDALALVLDSLARQTLDSFDVVVADDGSRADTRALIDSRRATFPAPLIHAWQDDDGFRAARARNLALTHARGAYVVFLDGDCVVLPTFLENHLRFAETGWFTVGRRCFLRRWASEQILRRALPIETWPRAVLFALAAFGGSNRPFQLLPIPQSASRRKNRPTEWDKAQTCNLGVWRSDIDRVGGFEEGYGAYGLEDTDFVIRLIRAGVRRITLEHVDPVLHLWHARKKTGEDNRARLEALIQGDALLPQRSLLLDAAG